MGCPPVKTYFPFLFSELLLTLPNSNCSVYFLLPAALPAHAAALFSTRPLSGFPAQSPVLQANPAFPI